MNLGPEIPSALGPAFMAAAATAAGGSPLEALSAGYSVVLIWAAVVAIPIVPSVLALITIDKKTFSGVESDAPAAHL